MRAIERANKLLTANAKATDAKAVSCPLFVQSDIATKEPLRLRLDPD
jgi:hypothetical protein